LHRKLEFRNPKLEANSNVEIPMTETNGATAFAYLLFEFRFCFGFRVSDFKFAALPICRSQFRQLAVQGLVEEQARRLPASLDSI
jgi:hypothetical protein